jgi:hypothetical protein
MYVTVLHTADLCIIAGHHMKRASAAITIVCIGMVSVARAEVSRVEIKTRADVGATGVEKIVGKAYFSVDARDRHNRIIVDLDKAPTNGAGRVEFAADFYVLKPKSAGNGAALVDVLNRGGKPALTGFNRGGTNDPSTDADLGDRFLLRQGFTVAWIGWELDIPDQPGLMRIYAPFATDQGKAITGVVRASFTPPRGPEFIVTDLMNYDAVDPGGPDSQLTVRSAFLSRGEPIARARWHVKGHTVVLDEGFDPSKIYEISYRATNPPVAGLGFIAMRDFATWLRHQPDSVAPVSHAYAFGSSQSGRFLRDFLYEGFNADERDRQVFDGVMSHIAGAARIDLNARWSTPRGLGVHGATAFPFADASLRDPASGVQDGLLDNSRARAHQPKVFYTNTPVEYWGTGRVAALVHTSPDGHSDLTLPANVRFYFLAGTQHAPARFPPNVGAGQQRDNPVDYWWTMRALLLAMHRWVNEGVAPPPSAHPTLGDRTLVPAASVAFPTIPRVSSPRALTAGPRVANPFVAGGAGGGAPLPLLVPEVDVDGNELAGIRLPDVSVPLGTFTGWNFSDPARGVPGELVSLLGSFIPFAVTQAEREAARDPRKSIEERYSSRSDYLSRVRQAADALVQSRYLLADDVARVVQRAGDMWDLITRGASERLPR